MTDIHNKIDELVKRNHVILFMKGTREQPQCGFSRQVVDVLKRLVADFVTVDVLSDSAMREGIKVYASWPTIPQLFVKGEFIGGCDIVLDLYRKNELQGLLGVEKAKKTPSIKISERALNAFKNAMAKEPGDDIRISIGADFEHNLQFDTKNMDDFQISQDGVNLLLDPYSALRAENLSIDFNEEALESGFFFENPNEPPTVQELAPTDLVRLREKQEVLLVDVRPKDEWLSAHIDFARRLEEMSPNEIASLDKNKAIVFHCHHGGRSLRMANAWRARGFKNLYNLRGGIDAWSRQVDKTVPLY
ncbi:MAG TPA: Grx4 family monothiol glutaredoxin [Myxococcota bacterium]|nr:Grx4 family monothiol glutaredoxin [Myxococcota bacterium]